MNTKTVCLVFLALGLFLRPRAMARPNDPLYEIVGITWTKGSVRLITPTSEASWRRFDVSLPPGAKPDFAALSTTGTKLLVRVNGNVQVADLTGTVPLWKSRGSFRRNGHSHCLPDEKFLVVAGSRLTLVNDDLEPSFHDFDAPIVAAERNRAGVSLVALHNRRMFILASGRRIPVSGSINVKGLAVAYGADQFPGVHDQSRFIALTEDDGRFAGYVVHQTDAGKWEVGTSPIIEPQDSLEKATLMAHLSCSRASRAVAVSQLVRALNALQCDPQGPWRFVHIRPEPYLYMPVLQFHDLERVFPGSTDIWSKKSKELSDVLYPASRSAPTNGSVRPKVPGNGSRLVDAVLYLWYIHLPYGQKCPLNHKEECRLYYRERSYPGSWLLEYWTYYPLDYGGVDRHLHDSEHIFIEVDKLTGRPRAVYASAHSGLTANNIYSSVDRVADPPLLPLFAFVELGKHAAAPDIDRDGFFTFGRDVNTYSEQAQIWGVRDHIGETDQHLNKFESSMVAPRRREYRLASRDFGKFFPAFVDGQDWQVSRDNCRCRLLPFPSGGNKTAKIISEDYAISALTQHPDSKDPASIFKTWYAPDYQVRIGFGQGVGTKGREYWAGFVFRISEMMDELRKVPGVRRFAIPVPGQLATELAVVSSFAESGIVDLAIPGSMLIERRFVNQRYRRSWSPGFRYEKMLSNIFGFQGGASYRVRVGSETGRQHQWVYRMGALVALPLKRNASFSFHLGPTRTSAPFDDWGFEIRANYVLKSWRGRRTFGIKD